MLAANASILHFLFLRFVAIQLIGHEPQSTLVAVEGSTPLSIKSPPTCGFFFACAMVVTDACEEPSTMAGLSLLPVFHHLVSENPGPVDQ
ncbi:hypothetical protein [Pseudomonas sp. H3(2019)]|uniref:hypothetical protein n=1 Tax=Pseudomonas sp. H3(2019) TaxID=2598724 RepID=UPI0015B786D9|nr:hypothetical protein [Pseudomonas sp. H3(2019)]